MALPPWLSSEDAARGRWYYDFSREVDVPGREAQPLQSCIHGYKRLLVAVAKLPNDYLWRFVMHPRIHNPVFLGLVLTFVLGFAALSTLLHVEG